MPVSSYSTAGRFGENLCSDRTTACFQMNDGNIHTYREMHGGALLEWTNRVDAHGGRIDWRIATDTEGWTCRLGPVHNHGITFGSRVVNTMAEEKALLDDLRSRIINGAGIHSHRPGRQNMKAA